MQLGKVIRQISEEEKPVCVFSVQRTASVLGSAIETGKYVREVSLLSCSALVPFPWLLPWLTLETAHSTMQTLKKL